MQDLQVSFGTNFKFTNSKGFARAKRGFSDNRVDRPWTKNQIIRASRAYTTNIKTCTAGGIVVKNNKQDCFDVVMFHIDPDNDTNKNFTAITETILKKLGKSNPMNAFLIGSKHGPLDLSMYRKSIQMFNRFERFFNKLKIPYSKLKGTLDDGVIYVNVAYNGYKDDLTIYSSASLNPSKKFIDNDRVHKIFHEVKFLPTDTLSVDEFCLKS